jgi:hypothetical protein
VERPDLLEHREHPAVVAQQEPADHLVQPEHREVVGLLVQVVQVDPVVQAERAVRLAQLEHPEVVAQQEPADHLVQPEHREVVGLLVQAEILSPRLAR